MTRNAKPNKPKTPASLQPPENWPSYVKYLVRPSYSPRLTEAHLAALRTRPAPDPADPLPELPRHLPRGPCPAVRIQLITDPRHPACGQAGLFAARDLAPGELILPYLGEVHIGTYPFGRPPENDRALGLSLEGTGAATVVICSSERHDGDLSTGTRGDAIENPSSEMKCDFNPSSLLNPTPAAVPDDTVAAATDDKRNNPPEHKEEGDQEDDDYDYAKSDYDLWLDRDADLAVDAARMGNEARFINDYRGVPDQPLKQQGTADTSDRNKGNKKNRKMKHQGSKGQNGSCDFDGKGQTAKTKTKPNAEFRVAWDPRTGEKCMAVFVVRAGKKAVEQDVGIREGEEILVSYGRGFWAERRREMEEGRGRDGDGEK